MIVTIDIATIEYYIDSKYILYGYNDGGLTIEVDYTDRNCLPAIEMFEFGTVTGIRVPSYAGFKSATSGIGFVEFAHSTLTAVYVNCNMIRRVSDNGSSTTLIHFNNGQNLIVNVAYSTVIASIATALQTQLASSFSKTFLLMGA